MEKNYAILLDKAIAFAVEKHKGQLDKSGAPYILHPLHVMDQCKSPKEKIVAILHDIIEDTDATLQDLRNLGLDEEIVEAIDAISRRKPQETYKEFIFRCKKNKLARSIKIKDIEHNTSWERQLQLGDVDNIAFLMKRYTRALCELHDVGKEEDVEEGE